MGRREDKYKQIKRWTIWENTWRGVWI